jgi:U3 small nucleolar RNA-associated protein 10
VSKSRWENLVSPTLAQMAASISDDTLWKQLNYQILLKTRHDSAEVRKIMFS